MKNIAVIQAAVPPEVRDKFLTIVEKGGETANLHLRRYIYRKCGLPPPTPERRGGPRKKAKATA